MQSAKIPTKLLILSDTHADPEIVPSSFVSQEPVDVVIHCGDLTDGSKLEEYRTTLSLLAQIDAPLKLIIPGNHDFTLDDGAFRKIRTESLRLNDGRLDEKSLDDAYGRVGQAKEMLVGDGIRLLLEEGIYTFTLGNGARLTVFASPFTPSKSNSNWGFQYHPDQGHDWSGICSNQHEGIIDVAITHGPPQGILDRASGQRLGCPQLFSSIARARPRVHCFGHIHESWGAKHVVWKDQGESPGTDDLNHYTCIDNDKSQVIESIATLRPTKFDDEDAIRAKGEREQAYRVKRAVRATQGHGSESGSSSSTLFVNAAVQGPGDGSFQLPWIVTVDLDRKSGQL
ncbi:Metallo-dependent phosphatase-like protein [Emericellopsis atlantica]|uniref:Metallo-dependent phosphatase-like protein n=1 Tax=Emericellopsis atlantica TaxID=2614577 RepID=A0A9P7ZHN4_9HYPO|nr:Metallo-dependent phosphatase-like protein [Emericellopsis atlantica]KAG9252264.1 Metallo-dependent phosphatase-like protein [Emericellopsis atlantica]